MKKLNNEDASMQNFNNLDSMQEMVIQCSYSGKIRKWNKAGEDITGFSSKEVNNRDIGFLFSKSSALTLKRIMAFVKEGSSFPPIEAEMQIKNGQSIPVDVVIYKEEDGLACIVRDVTLKDLLLKKKYEYAELYKNLVEHSSAMIYVLDTDGKIVFINATGIKMLDYVKDEIVGQPLLNFIHPEDRERIFWNVQERRKAERATWNVEVRLVPKNNKARLFELDYIFASLNSYGLYTKRAGRGMQSEGEEFIGTQGIARDITELKVLKKFVKNVETILPICSICHKIRTTVEGQEVWMPIEQYINRKGGIKFSHTICPECAKRFNHNH
ncbi:MAG: PAS domain-containing protein [Spirochaetales bacterium]|nr:PAS domain-containing protein [Spirochaetales bacterium]